MTKIKAIIITSILLLASVIAPAIVINRSITIRSGYKGIPWGRTQYQVEEWVRSNNNKITWTRCPFSHYGVTCCQVKWKQNEKTPFEYIEFQFKDEKLVAVIETEHEKQFEKTILQSLGKSDNGKDYKRETYREKGVKYELRDWVNYYIPAKTYRGTKVRHALNLLYRKNLTNPEEPEEKLMYQLTTGYYSPSYFEEARLYSENFPSHHFLNK